MKKVLALVLCLCLAFAMLPVVAFAAETEYEVDENGALTGVGIEFDYQTNPAVKEDWTCNKTIGLSSAKKLKLSDSYNDSTITAVYKDTFDLSNGFTVAYQVHTSSSKNLAKNVKDYLGVGVGNVTAVIRPASTQDALYLVIKVDGAIVATSETAFYDSTCEGWNAANSGPANIEAFTANTIAKYTFVLDYDVTTGTITYSVSRDGAIKATVSYVDTGYNVVVNDAAIKLVHSNAWGVHAYYNTYVLEGKTASSGDEGETGSALVGLGFKFSSELPTVIEDWTLSHEQTKVNTYGGLTLNDAGGGKANHVTAVYKDTFDLSNGFTLTYTASGPDSGNYTNDYMGRANYFGAIVGNVSAYVVYPDATGFTLEIKIGDTVVATSEKFDFGEKTRKNYFYYSSYFTFDYDVATDTITFSVVANNRTDTVSYVDTAKAVDVSDAAITLRSHSTWDIYAEYKAATLIGKAAPEGGDEPEVHVHTEGEAVVENKVDADCDTAGSYDSVVYCTECGEEISRTPVTVDALGHTEVVDEAVAPTLNSTGLTEGKHCSVCGETIVAQTEVPMLKGEAAVNGYNYATFAEAYAAAQDGDTLTLAKDVTFASIFTLDKAITLDGAGYTWTCTGNGTSVRAINVDVNGTVTIKNLTIVAEGAERAINVISKPAIVNIENVTATAANYTVNAATSAAGTVINITNSTLTGLNVVNIAAPGAVVTVDNTTLNCMDKNDDEDYAALTLNAYATNGTITATNVVFNVTGNSSKASVGADGGVITIDGSAAEVEVNVAIINYGDYFYSFTSLEDAIAKAQDGETIVLIADVVLTETLTVGKKVTIDLNGYDITADFTAVYAAIYVSTKGDLTIVGEGSITSTDVAIGVYGALTVKGGTIAGDYAAIYNYYYSADIYGEIVIDGATVEGWVLNCGELAVESGAVAWIDNSGALAVNGGSVEYIYAQDGSDAAGVAGAGTVAVADPSIIEVPEGYILIEVDGKYVAHAHSYKDVVTDPTCTADGYTTYTCDCGDSYVDDKTDALGHTWGEWEVTTEATPEAAGVKTRVCGTCGATETQEYVLDKAGVTGEVTWRIEDGTLYIEGNGKMDNYLNQGHTVPWKDYYREVTAIVIGDGVTYVGNRAFRGFNRVTTVTFGKDVTTMGYECFYLCTKLENVYLNEGLTAIGSLTFYGCTSLKQIDIPSTVTTLNNRAFKGSGLTSVVVPDTVTATGYEVFMNCADLAEVTFSKGVSMLNPRTFENCTSLKTFYFTKNMCRIRSRAFYGCTALESITFEDANYMWGSSNGQEAKMASNAFEGCNSTLKLIAADDTHVEDYAARFGFVFEAK